MFQSHSLPKSDVKTSTLVAKHIGGGIKEKA